MTRATSYRPLVRLAWREVKRNRRRSALVIALIAVPVAILTMLSTFIRTATLSPSEERAVTFGPHVDAIVGQANRELELPTGATAARLDTVQSALRSGGSLRRGVLVRADLGDALLAHLWSLDSGRLPRAADEVAIGSALARRTGLRPGDQAELAFPARIVTIVGVADRRDQRGDVILAPAGFELPATARPYVEYFVDLGPTATLRDLQVGVTNGYVRGFGPSKITRDAIAALYTGGVIALFITGLIASAAFAVGARRQLRSMGLVAANGADPRAVARVVTLQGTLVALVASLVGMAVAAAALAITAGHWNRWSGLILPGVEINLVDHVATLVLATLAGTLAASLPGRALSRAPILAALAGRRPLPAIRAGQPVAGFVCIGVGLAVLGVATGRDTIGWQAASLASLVVLIGGVLCAGWLVAGLESVAARLGGSTRLAVRRLARHRSRSGPIVGAIMAVAAGAIALSSLTLSQQRYDGRFDAAATADRVTLQPPFAGEGEVGQPVGRGELDRVLAVLPGARAARWSGPRVGPLDVFATIERPSRGLGGDVVVGDADLLELFDASPAAIDALRRGQAVLVSRTWTPSRVELRVHQQGDRGTADRTESLDVFPLGAQLPLADGRVQYCDEDGCGSDLDRPVLVVPTVLARRLGLGEPRGAMIRLPEPIDEPTRNRLRAVQRQLDDEALVNGHDPVTIAYQFGSASLWIVRGVATALVGLAAAVVTIIGISLMAAESATDDALLASLGASPRTRRRTRAVEAGVLSGMGTLLAVPLGFVPALVVGPQVHRGQMASFPWLVVSILAVGLPLALAAAGWLTGRSSPRSVVVVLD